MPPLPCDCILMPPDALVALIKIESTKLGIDSGPLLMISTRSVVDCMVTRPGVTMEVTEDVADERLPVTFKSPPMVTVLLALLRVIKSLVPSVNVRAVGVDVGTLMALATVNDRAFSKVAAWADITLADSDVKAPELGMLLPIGVLLMLPPLICMLPRRSTTPEALCKTRSLAMVSRIFVDKDTSSTMKGLAMVPTPKTLLLVKSTLPVKAIVPPSRRGLMVVPDTTTSPACRVAPDERLRVFVLLVHWADWPLVPSRVVVCRMELPATLRLWRSVAMELDSVTPFIEPLVIWTLVRGRLAKSIDSVEPDKSKLLTATLLTVRSVVETLMASILPMILSAVMALVSMPLRFLENPRRRWAIL